MVPQTDFANQWKSETVVIVASGPSLTRKQVEYCRGKARVLVINDNYKLAPWADALYACDGDWWDLHQPGFEGQKWTQDQSAALRYNLNWVKSVNEPGFSKNPDVIHQGGNSGYQAINLALHFGVSKVLLLGFDMKMNGKRHWFGDHPGRLNKASNYSRWLKNFATVKTDKVINCTPDSALECFPKMSLREALG